MGREAAPVLKGVKCLVDVHMSAGDVDVDCSAAVRKKLEGLGAKIVKRLGRDTTHVVWLNGNRNVREDTLKRSELKLVGPLWVEACAQTATRVPETKFFPADAEKNKATPLPSPASEKKKRRRSSLMEPRREDVFDEVKTPIKKTRRQTLEKLTPVNVVLTPQESVNARHLSLRRRSRSPDYDDLSQPTMTILPTVEEVPEPLSQAEVKASPALAKSAEKQLTTLSASKAKTNAKASPAPIKSAEKQLATASNVKEKTDAKASPAPTKSAEKLLTTSNDGKVKANQEKNKTGWSCVSCTFDNNKLARKCKMCGTSSTGNMPRSVRKATPEKSTPHKPITRQAKQTEANAETPTRRLDLTSPSPAKNKLPIGKPKTPPSTQKPKSNIIAPSIPVIKTTPSKSEKSSTSSNKSTNVNKPSTKVNSQPKLPKNIEKKGANAVETSVETKSAMPKEKQTKPSKRKVDDAVPQRNVKSKTVHDTPKVVEPKKSLKSKEIKPVNSNDQSKPAKIVKSSKEKITRNVISISGANMDTKLILESTIRELDACGRGGKKSAIVDDFGASVTHVVVSDQSKRTMKILFGLAQGAWIVSDAWVFSSLEAKKWLDEKDFMLKQYPIAQKKPPKLLEGKTIFIGSGLEPPKSTLQSLIAAAGGKTSTQLSQSNLCIGIDQALGRRSALANVPMVNPKWLFDSLASGTLQPLQ